MARADGYKMVGGIVQDARTYDPTTGQWLTPDAYAGDVHDPMSQKPFMWNNNNPVQWSDPSGYDPTTSFEQFLSNMWSKLERALSPGNAQGNRSGGLSSPNIRRMQDDFSGHSGTMGHVQKFQDSLRSIIKLYRESYADQSTGAGAGARETLRAQYSNAINAGRAAGYSDSQMLSSPSGSLPSSLPSEQQSLFNMTTGQSPLGGPAGESGESPSDIPEIEVPPDQHTGTR